MMTAEPVSAKDAESMGMIYEVFSDDSFVEASWKFARKLAEMPTKGLGLTKRLLNASYSNNLEEQLDMEDKCQTIAGNSADFKEGVQAFLEKRKPNFKGA
jgi:2-(1,2-epoxy-1,2-dihydrophenyl)acetyl-CoA isomerase